MGEGAEVVFKGAFPIGGEVARIPVKEVGPAIGYYVHVLGFTVVSRDTDTATLRRGDAEIGLVVSGENPEEVSIYFSVSDVDTLHSELWRKGIEPSEIREDTHGGNIYRVFFAKEPYGVCFCFGQPKE
jgi:predicted enzyme related to lactoylglutathione lyase